MEAEFVHGTPLMVDYTPGSNVAVGEIIPVGTGVVIAHNAISSGALGAVAKGGGVYRLPKATTSGSAIAFGDKVFWDNAANIATETTSSNNFVGTCVDDGGVSDSDEYVLVAHTSPAS